MQVATAETVQPQPGEAAFLLQLRPPACGDAEVLAAELERFTALFLGRAETDTVRFAPLGGLSWMLAAPVEAVDAVDAACDALAELLFGDPASEAVELTRQPDPEPAVDMDMADIPEPVDDPAATEDDDWTLAEPGQEPVEGAEDAPGVIADDGASEDAWDLAEPANPDPVEPEALAQAADVESDGHDVELQAAAPDADADTDWTLEVEGEDGVDLDAFAPLGDDAADAADAAGTEANHEALDLAAELSAFRAEMKRIAETIPAAGGDAALAEFRASLESISGELGQRVDGAAQRIEAAAEQVTASVDPSRLEAAGERVERAAALIETSVRDALTALTAAEAVMGDPAPQAAADEAAG